tara:strand:- start:821 stop:964 length:144 start_codon:yes stop_codon:yes gene_type:complete
MKKLLGILVLSLLWCNTTLSEEYGLKYYKEIKIFIFSSIDKDLFDIL